MKYVEGPFCGTVEQLPTFTIPKPGPAVMYLWTHLLRCECLSRYLITEVIFGDVSRTTESDVDD